MKCFIRVPAVPRATRLGTVLAAGLAAASAATPAGAATAKNLLFFGNSFTIGSSSVSGTGAATTSTPGFVPTIVRNIAVAAGQATPNVYYQVSGGQSLDYHINKVNSDGTASVVRSPGLAWDTTVLQEYSTKPTTHSTDGNIADFRQDAKTLYGLVRGNSPNAKAVLFETWARGYGHPFYNPASADYQPTLVNPSTMQTQLRTSYGLANGDLNSVYGSGTSSIAPVGDAFAYGNFNNLYNSDIYHANNRGYLLAAMALYSTIYRDDVSDINLTSVAAALGITAADEKTLAGWSDAVTAVPEPGCVLTAGVAASALLRRRSRAVA